MMKQRTIASPVKTVGIGLHSGCKVTISIKPAPINSGVQFVRMDTPEQSVVPATALAVCDTRLASVIQKDGVRVSTVEHLLSACAGLGLDNLFIELDGEEVPIMDGSAASFLFLIESAGIAEQEAPRQFMVIKKPVEVRDGEYLLSLALLRQEGGRTEQAKYFLDLDHPDFFKLMDKCVLSNRALATIEETETNDSIKFIKQMPHFLNIFVNLAKIYFIPGIDTNYIWTQ